MFREFNRFVIGCFFISKWSEIIGLRLINSRNGCEGISHAWPGEYRVTLAEQNYPQFIACLVSFFEMSQYFNALGERRKNILYLE